MPTPLPIAGLPIGLPSTFLGKHGWVQYYCKTALKEASGLAHKNQQVFIVMNPIDLNQEPAILAVRPFSILTSGIAFDVFLPKLTKSLFSNLSTARSSTSLG